MTHGVNPMCEAFPRIASCNYVRYGTGGMQEVRSAICILGLNMINDKVRVMRPEEERDLERYNMDVLA